MLLALIVAFVSVALGATLALGPAPNARVMRPIRWVALVSAVVVIATHLLPEAFHELGLPALGGFLGGMLLPTLIERFGSYVAKRTAEGSDGRHGHSAAALEIAYAGLVAHRFGDGLTLGGVTRSGGPPWATAGVLFALAAHIIPVTTVMILAILHARGRRSAVFRSALLAASTMAGVVAATVALSDGPANLGPWISAVVAGLLLHIVIHDLPRRGKAREPVEAPSNPGNPSIRAR